MAAITIPPAVQRYFPRAIDPEEIWVNYDPKTDTLIVYFTGQPVPSIWNDLDKYAYIGFALDNDKVVTGLMIEHFSAWLLAPGAEQELQPV